MLPIVFDWHWTIDRLIFMGLLYVALTLVGAGLATAFFMTLKNLYKGGSDHGHGHDH